MPVRDCNVSRMNRRSAGRVTKRGLFAVDTATAVDVWSVLFLSALFHMNGLLAFGAQLLGGTRDDKEKPVDNDKSIEMLLSRGDRPRTPAGRQG